jgi:outer membrane protein insertion porin family
MKCLSKRNPAGRLHRASKGLAIVKTALMALLVVGVHSVAGAQPPQMQWIRQVSFTGDGPDTSGLIDALCNNHIAIEPPADAMCACLLELQRIAESQGRLDLSVVVETNGNSDPVDVTAHVRMGSQYSVGRIDFTGHGAVNDSILRRAFTLRERDLFDVGTLRRGLARLNEIGLIERVTFADIIVTKHTDGATADITIPLHKRGWRSWALSGPIIPGLGSYQASISSRLPAWGRGALDASTYLVTFSVLAFAKPSLGLLTFMSGARPAAVLIERPYLPGQEWLSGFAVSPSFSARTTVTYYGRAQLERGVRAVLEHRSREALVVPVVGSGGPAGEFLSCQPARSRWRWLRRGAVHAVDIALSTALP